jgi:putative redox protein
MSRESYQSLVHGTAAALAAGSDERALVTFRATSSQVAGVRSNVQIRDFTVAVDEPPALGGINSAPNPVEYALAALATCQEITYRLHADALGIPLDGVSVSIEGDIDLRGFFGVDDGIRPGFRAIRGTVELESSAPESELERLRTYVDAHCPVLDLITSPTPVTLDLRTVAAASAGALA